ncbi:hypothetical protein [Desulfobacterium sp. N47]|uniref:hypothetical protein n=1 Tax=Desulfobacterium sp. N47 TaxID=3115210 RepID=UPI003F4A578E
MLYPGTCRSSDRSFRDWHVFASGIGENAPTVRAQISNGLKCLGIELEEKRNNC